MSIAAREKDEKISYGVLDPSAFAEDGGPSIAERIGKGSANKVYFRPADNRRVVKRAPWAAATRCGRGWSATRKAER
jgi:hypothetical protein